MKKNLSFSITFTALLIICFYLLSLPANGEVLNGEEKQLQSFIDNYTKRVAPIERDSNIADWNAYVTGEKQEYEKKARLSLEVDLIHSENESYKTLLKLKESRKIRNPILARELAVLIDRYGPKQIKPEYLKKIRDKESEAELAFNTYRGIVDGKEINEKDIYAILKTSSDRNLKKKAWEAQKAVGKKVAPLLLELVKVRNEAARSLGFANFYEMKIQFGDQNLEELGGIFKNLFSMTEKSFKSKKKKLDIILAKRDGTRVDELMPWDYPNPFFQEAAGLFTSDMDKYYKGKNLEEIATTFYSRAGLPIIEILKNSDLFEKPGKSQHAFCYDIDRGQDIRILVNMRQDEDSCATILHELGHAVYDKNIDQNLPWLLRESSHIFTTEASAMMFERLTRNPKWLEAMIGVPRHEADLISNSLKEELALQQLIFCRWTEVMFNFERELYRDPNQDLNRLWWDLVEKYQNVRRPENRDEPDWASKIHFASAPVYYHNYMLGELMVSQVMHTLGTKVIQCGKDWPSLDFINKPELGKWLIENIYSPGAKYRWNELLIHATGETLTPKYFAEQFIEKE